MIYPHAFPRAWCQLAIFPSSPDWFIGLFSTVVIGQSDYFGFGFTALKWKHCNIEKWNLGELNLFHLQTLYGNWFQNEWNNI